MVRKRAPVLVLSSSSSEGEDEPSRSRSTSAPASRKRPKGAASKKPAFSRSRKPPRSSRYPEPVEFDMLSEDFSDCLSDVRIAPGLAVNEAKELWVDKHKPRSLAELTVHKKKVQEVKIWLEDRLKTSKEGPGGCTLLITGQAGVGKSTAVHVIASELGAELYEWATPTPTLWQEHVHNSALGIRYMSKLEEFEMFVEKIRKYPLLRPTYTGGSCKPVILLIDDLPITNGRVAFLRLSRCLTTLAQSTQVPTVISITEYCKSEPSDSSSYYWEDLESLLEKAGAYKVIFNPLTVNSIKKTLSRICQDERCNLSVGLIGQIAEASGGDIRHAVMSLQYGSLGLDSFFHSPVPSLASIDCKRNSHKATAKIDEEPNGKMFLPFGRDESLTLFHALGKFLHNKREITDTSASGPHSFLLQEKLVRKQLKMDAPEKILSQAHAQSRPIVDFLHENVLDFLNDDLIDDASVVTSYLSDADCILASALNPLWSRMINERYELESIAQSVAASVAVRGVLFGNSMPASKWHVIRRPKVWQIEQSARLNKHQMVMERLEITSSSDLSDIATEYRPRAKWLGSQTSEEDHMHEKLLYYSKRSEVESDWMDPDSYLGDDEIEDW